MIATRSPSPRDNTPRLQGRVDRERLEAGRVAGPGAGGEPLDPTGQ